MKKQTSDLWQTEQFAITCPNCEEDLHTGVCMSCRYHEGLMVKMTNKRRVKWTKKK